MVVWVNDERTVLVRTYQDNEMPRRRVLEVCTRPEPEAVWGPPITVKEER